MNTPLFDLSGQVAIVTGTSRGLGQYMGRALARAGADLVITSRNPATLEPFRKEIEAMGRRAVPVELDVRDYDSIQRMAEAVDAAYGRIDILVNNAGCNVRKPAVDVSLGRLEPGARHQPARHLLRGAGGGETHDPARLRAHHQHRLGYHAWPGMPGSDPTAPAAAASSSSP